MMKIVVCGAGTMGIGIAETSARNGYSTLLYDPSSEATARAENAVRKNLSQLLDKNRITKQELDDTMARLSFTQNLDQCRGDLVIEAIIEDLPAKTALFNKLADINQPAAIFASNTSSLPIRSIAAEAKGPERMAGLHFFNPAQVMKLVEVVHAPSTSAETIEKLKSFALSLGKTPVVCKDSPGFIVNRVARHYYLEALQVLEENITTVEQADRILENAGFRMGPFRLMDLIGNDINFTVTKSLYEACGRPVRFRPSAIQEGKVINGELGKKTGKGYYSY